MSTHNTLKEILASTLEISTENFNTETELLGAIPELDSMAIMTLLMAIEEQFPFHIDSEDITAEHFATLGSLEEFVELQQARV